MSIWGEINIFVDAIEFLVSEKLHPNSSSHTMTITVHFGKEEKVDLKRFIGTFLSPG